MERDIAIKKLEELEGSDLVPTERMVYLKSKVLKSIWKPVQREPTGAISTKRRFLLMPKNFWKKKPKR
jgi:hypothetical protein